MNRFVLALFCLLSAGPALAAEAAEKPSARAASASDPFGVSRSLKDSIFVVETDDTSATESLNRVSGEIDLGFTTPDQEYVSDHQGGGTPVQRSEAAEKAHRGY